MLLLFSNKKSFLKEFDRTAIIVIIYGGILWFLLLYVSMGLWHLADKTVRQEEFYNYYISNEFHPFIIIQSLFHLLCTQLFRFKKIAKFLLLRLILVFLFSITLEIYTIIATTIARDGLTAYLSSMNFILGIRFLRNVCIKIILFIFITSIIHFGTKYFRKKEA